MGISTLRKLLNEYIKTKPEQKINSNICYIDYTYKIILSTNNVIQQYKFSNEYTPNELINMIIDKSVQSIVTQIKNNKYYSEYIISLDFRNINNMNSKFHFSNEIITNYINNFWTNKEKIESIPMIPKGINLSDSDGVKTCIRNMYEVRYNYWKPNKGCVLNYIPIQTLIDQTTDEFEKKIFNEYLNFGYARYILFRDAKHQVRLRRKILYNKRNTIDNFIEEELKNSNDFDKDIRNYLYSIPYTMIISQSKNIISRIISQLQGIKIQFIGCENESDFAIRKHILAFNSLNCPTIYTRDTDLIALLCDVNCVIKIPYQDRNVPIYPHDFWAWVFNTSEFNYDDVITICVLLGTDYNQSLNKIRTENALKLYNQQMIQKFYMNYKKIGIYNFTHNYVKEMLKNCLNTNDKNELINILLSLEIYKQAELVEYSIYYIKPEKQIDYSLINLKYANLYTINLNVN